MAHASQITDPVRAKAHAQNRIRMERTGRGALHGPFTMDDFLAPDLSDDGLFYGLFGCEMCGRLAVEGEDGVKTINHREYCDVVVLGIAPLATVTTRDYNWAYRQYKNRPKEGE